MNSLIGEGRWTVEAAIEEAVAADVITAALFTRFRSRQDHTFGEKMLSAVRFGFGGQVEGQEPVDPDRNLRMRHVARNANGCKRRWTAPPCLTRHRSGLHRAHS